MLHVFDLYYAHKFTYITFTFNLLLGFKLLSGNDSSVSIPYRYATNVGYPFERVEVMPSFQSLIGTLQTAKS